MKLRRVFQFAIPLAVLAAGMTACDETTPVEVTAADPRFGEDDGEGGGDTKAGTVDPSGYGQTIATTGTLLLDRICDIKLVPPGFPTEPGHTYVFVERGTHVKLAPGTYECTPVVDAAGTLVAGQGVYVMVDQITFDLNGATVRSTLKAIDLHPDVGNGGVIVLSNNVTVTNTSATAALVEGFTQNLEFDGAQYSKLAGQKLADGSFNLVSGRSGDGVALSVDGVDQLRVEQVRLADVGGTMGAGAGAFVNRSTNVTIQNSDVGGWTYGVDIRRSSGIVLQYDEICGGGTDINADDPASYTSLNNTFCTKTWY